MPYFNYINLNNMSRGSHCATLLFSVLQTQNHYSSSIILTRWEIRSSNESFRSTLIFIITRLVI